MPPPPLIAPTPSKVRPPDDPLIVIEVAARAGVATAAPSPPAAMTMPDSSAALALQPWSKRASLDTLLPFHMDGGRP